MPQSEATGLPPGITTSWAGQDAVPLRLRYVFPKIWTQKQSRPFGLYWSDDLAFGKLHPAPMLEELDRFYAFDTYDDYLSGTSDVSRTYPSFTERVITRLAWLRDRSEPGGSKFLRPRVTRDHTVCDVGCGSGNLLAGLQPHVKVVTGVDPSPASLAALEQKGFEGLEGTAEDLPQALRERRFDLVTMQQSLEHCRDPATALDNIRALCADHGHCLIEVPNHACFGFDRYGPVWFHTDAGRHLHFFTAKSLCALLEHAGFAPLHVGYRNYTRQFGGDWYRSMQEVWDGLYRDGSAAPVSRPTPKNAALDFVKSLTLEPAQQYDVLRVFCAAA